MSKKSDKQWNNMGKTNHLAGETSPYLLQHAHNPVDWYPWGEEALNRARDENKPIFLSIGYSACHWCHVMERESFEDPDVAKVLNENFISIKVDREERPDLDEIYMTAVQLMTGSGGWPLNVFLTPDLKPFFGGTYFPPRARYGQPGFGEMLTRIAEVWRGNSSDIMRSADELTDAIRMNAVSHNPPADTLAGDLLEKAAENLGRNFDKIWGGFGQAPKFPPNGAISVLLRHYEHTGDKESLAMVEQTLERMAYGGMYDQLGGGFHRYSTDDRWLVPHFEKMLYDNALLGRVYLEAWQATHKDLYRRVADEIFTYVLRDLRDRHGGFHSSEDADSEGEEGKFYVWSRDEIEATLGRENGSFFSDYYGVTARGNFEGQNILYVPRDREQSAAAKSAAPEATSEHLERLRGELLEVREKRERPGKDDKVLAAWNGLMISALARGYQVLDRAELLKAAEDAAGFVLSAMMRDGLLLRSYRGQNGSNKKGVSKLPAYLDDYAEMANGLIDLYEASFESKWLDAADELANTMVADFYDHEYGGFYYTSASHKNLLVRTKPFYDGAVPSGNSTASLVLLRLSRLLDNADYFKKAKETITSAREMMASQPGAYLNLLVAADLLRNPGQEIAVAGGAEEKATEEFLRLIHERFLPNKILARVDPESPDAKALGERMPLLAGKSRVSGKAAVYVCENYACRKPVTDTAALDKLLGGAR